MAEITQLFQVNVLPGIKRDGTHLDGDAFNDGQWARFQRGRPKKMGGFQEIVNTLSGPVRDMRVWSRENLNAILSLSPYGIEQVLVDNNGLGSSIINRTPSGFTANQNVVWSTDTQYDDKVGSTGTVFLAHASSSLVNIDSTVATKPYLGLATGDGLFTQITDAPAVSGGIFSVAPYTFLYGSDGQFEWSDANLPQTWRTSAAPIGDAGGDRITGSKIIKGLPLRSGSGAAALLWSLDSVIRMDWAGGGAIFKFSHLTSQSSVLSQRSIIEYDGVYFWMGVDRFLACDSGQVKELPNQMNLNWVFDNLNFAQRQKVWAMKVPRFGEIWWFFPYGDAEECTHAAIFNVREQIWYDTRCARSAGYYSQVLHYPVMADAQPDNTKAVLTLTGGSGTVSVGDNIHGINSGASGTVLSIASTLYTILLTSSERTFIVGETVTDTTSGATRTMILQQGQYSAWLHEKGKDQVSGDQVTAIESMIETCDFGLPTGGAQPNQIQGANRWTRLARVEPDFIQTGDMTLEVIGKEFANSPMTVSSGYNFTSTTERIDMREQCREIRLRFTSNTVGGHYEMGRIILHTAPGDVRN